MVGQAEMGLANSAFFFREDSYLSLATLGVEEPRYLYLSLGF